MTNIFLDLLLGDSLEFSFGLRNLLNIDGDGLSEVWVGTRFLTLKIGDLWSLGYGWVYTFDHLVEILDE